MRGVMFDRFALDGQPTPLRNDIPIDRQYPVRSRFIPIGMNGADFKGVLVNGRLRAAAAHHISRASASTPSSSRSPTTSDGKCARARATRLRKAGAQGIPWAEQYNSILEHYERHGRFAWETFLGR